MSSESSLPSAMAVLDVEELDVAHAAWLSRAALQRPLRYPAELGVFSLRGEPTAILGAFQRAGDRPRNAMSLPMERRGSGGPTLLASPGIVWLQLALSTPHALVACEPPQLLNRYVRPLLRALTSLGRLSHYFGRDWIATEHRPSAWVGFAHHAGSGRSLVEALVAVDVAVWPSERSSFLGKAPRTLNDGASSPLTSSCIRDRIVAAYTKAFPTSAPPYVVPPTKPPSAALPMPLEEPPWTARRDEAIGELCAGRDAADRVRLGGAFMASSDVVITLEDGVAKLTDADASSVGRLVDEAFARPQATIFGVRDLRNVRDVLLEALSTRIEERS